MIDEWVSPLGVPLPRVVMEAIADRMIQQTEEAFYGKASNPDTRHPNPDTTGPHAEPGLGAERPAADDTPAADDKVNPCT